MEDKAFALRLKEAVAAINAVMEECPPDVKVEIDVWPIERVRHKHSRPLVTTRLTKEEVL